MIRFYNSKELSQKFKVKLAKWKRWSREFLPPDPLGGLQSGYARQFNSDEVFTVFLGGHLVSDLKYSIPDARQILQDLHQWLVDHDFYFDFSGTANAPQKPIFPIKSYRIFILSNQKAATTEDRFSYLLRGIIVEASVDLNGEQVRQTRFTESSIKMEKDQADLNQRPSYRALNVSVLRKEFLRLLNGI
jgi:hypothetical protein